MSNQQFYIKDQEEVQRQRKALLEHGQSRLCVLQAMPGHPVKDKLNDSYVQDYARLQPESSGHIFQVDSVHALVEAAFQCGITHLATVCQVMSELTDDSDDELRDGLVSVDGRVPRGSSVIKCKPSELGIRCLKYRNPSTHTTGTSGTGTGNRRQASEHRSRRNSRRDSKRAHSDYFPDSPPR